LDQANASVFAAVDEAMDASDVVALGHLYLFSVDVSVFSMFATSLQNHIEVGCSAESRLAKVDCSQDRLRKLISDPANDAQMIEGTLNIKRFVDEAVAGLFSSEEKQPVDENMVPATQVDIPVRAPMTISERKQQLELEDVIRVGLKAGMGSRQNAPAEWIGESHSTMLSKYLMDLLS
jgi:cullin-4